MQSLRDRMLEAPDEFDPTRLPPRFHEAQAHIRAALAGAADAAIPETTLTVVLVSEAMPRLVGLYGPEHAARILAMFSHCISADVPPARSRQ